MKWYVLHVKTGEELNIKTRLIKSGIKVITPIRRIQERKKGRWVTVERVVFPGYVFVKIEATAEIYYKIIGLSAVYRFLGGNGPEPVKQEEMKAILQFCSEEDIIGISEVYVVNQQVKVFSGPLKGYEGRIKKVDFRKGRAKVQFNILDKIHEVTLGIEMLQDRSQVSE